MKKLNSVVTALAIVLALLVGSGASFAADKAPAKVNLNTASAEQLVELPGIGPALATRIVEHRQKAGAFKSVQELMNVKGIGERSLQKLQPYLTVGDTPAREAGAR